MSHTREERLEALGRVMDTLDILRVRCPWDAKQTNESLRPNTIEETYELAQALLSDNQPEIKKELGDVLLHILFYSKIADEKGSFDIADVADALNGKLIFRHPHVFGTTEVSGSEQVEQNWEQLKLREKDGNRSVLAGVPEALPALIKAARIQEKAANVGFDWEDRTQVWDKVAEELSEVRQAVLHGSEAEVEQEVGDLLFSVINAARLFKVNPENALERTNRKFISRFNYIEEQARRQDRNLRDMTLAEMDALWNRAKELEKTAAQQPVSPAGASASGASLTADGTQKNNTQELS
ncbi:MAG: nucleoside triphosphate pyrophosphohydrolase [Muribaculaceae bacterium]|nr:nucleoside triphosphate pyrophosphohydrolase [Muribaculaceae bacterium]